MQRLMTEGKMNENNQLELEERSNNLLARRTGVVASECSLN